MNAFCFHIFDVSKCKNFECKFYDMYVTSGEDSSKTAQMYSKLLMKLFLMME